MPPELRAAMEHTLMAQYHEYLQVRERPPTSHLPPTSLIRASRGLPIRRFSRALGESCCVVSDAVELGFLRRGESGAE